MGVRSFLKKFLKRLLGEEFYGELRDSWNEGYQSALEDPEQPAAVAEEKAPPQATSTEPKKQWQPPAEWQQSKTRAESTTEAPPSPPRPPAPYRYFIRLPLVKEMTCLSKSSIYRLMGAGDFPKQISLGPRSVVWVRSQVEDWCLMKIISSQV